MPIIIGIILLAFAIWLMWQLLKLYWKATVYVLLPAGSLWGAGVAIVNYFVAFRDNIRRQGEPDGASQPAQKNYFFDRRAYQSLWRIITESWKKNIESAKKSFGYCKDTWYLAPLFFSAGISTCVFGTMVFLICSVYHIIIMGVVVLIVFSLYSFVWIIDASYRRCKLIFSDCPQCYTRGRLPAYHCPSCNEKHDKLYPGTYGILTRRCNCGQKIPTTFFNGRNKLEASCPECGYPIKSKELRPVPIPIVGAPSAGKTYLLHSMVSYIRKKYAPRHRLDFEFMDREAEFNAHIADLDAGRTLPKTVENNPVALNFFLKKGGDGSAMYFYDSAGEAFIGTQHIVGHKFYGYFKGLILVIDPFSIPEVQGKYKNELSSSNIKPSLTMIDDVFDNLVRNIEQNYGIKTTERISKPTAVVLSKTGVFDLPQTFATASKGKDMDERCKQFLRDNGEGALLNGINRKFANAQFFAVDSKGSNSFGIDGVADWLLGKISRRDARAQFANVLGVTAGLTIALGVVAALSLFAVKVASPSIAAIAALASRTPPSTAWYTDNINATSFTVSTAEELAVFGQIVNGAFESHRDWWRIAALWKKGPKKNSFAGKTVALVSDIDLSQYGNWVPIGDYSSDSGSVFSGTFDGGGHIIRNLTINRGGAERQGLFGRIDGGKVQNFGLDGVSIKGHSRVGGVAGVVNSKSVISGCHVSGAISGTAMVGSIAGTVADTSAVVNSYSAAAVSGDAAVGGVVGWVNANSSVASCYSTGSVRGRLGVGGVAGSLFDNSRLDGSYFSGTVSGSNEVGGVVGQVLSKSSAANSYSTGAVSGGGIVGGVAGSVFNESRVSGSYSSASVVGTGNSVGGVVGGVDKKSRVTGCAALNPYVRGLGINAGRVVGGLSASAISNNAAFSGMTNSVGTTEWGDKGAASKGGSGIAAAAILRDGTVGGRFTDAGGWTVKSGSLPGIGEAVAMPPHLQ